MARTLIQEQSAGETSSECCIVWGLKAEAEKTRNIACYFGNMGADLPIVELLKYFHANVLSHSLSYMGLFCRVRPADIL